MVPVPHLPRLVELRRSHAYGHQRDQFKYAHMIGWTREGDAGRPGSGLATVITIGGGGSMWLDLGRTHANGQYCDALGSMGGTTVDINAEGWGGVPRVRGKYLRLDSYFFLNRLLASIFRNCHLLGSDPGFFQHIKDVFRHAKGQIHQRIIIVNVDGTDKAAFQTGFI